MSPHLLVEISGHGYGHLAQTAPVLDALLGRHPGLRLTVRTAIPEAVVRGRLPHRFGLETAEVDVGMRMRSAVEVLPHETHVEYRRFHRDWPTRVAARAAALARAEVDLVLSDVAYLSLAAARAAGIPAVAMSSLDWAAIYRRYCATLPEAEEVLAEIVDAYRCADAFLRLEPGAPADRDLTRVVPIGPVGVRGRRDPAGLRRAAGVDATHRLVLVALGGIPTALDVGRWPRTPGVRWLAPAAAAGGPAVTALERLDMAFPDVLASCDAVITKPGYGTFVEAACNAIPVLYSRRADWPEEPHLSDWLRARVPVEAVDWDDLLAGRFAVALERLLAARPRPATAPSGVAQAADYLSRRLAGTAGSGAGAGRQ